MGYLTNLADVIRRAGLNVIEEPGWQTRARGSGAYANGRPTHVMVHHTASNPSSDGQADVNYMCYNSGDRPIANLYLDRSGTVWVLAAGATNTNGKGADTWGGGVPNDKMNEYSIGIEGANNGTGEPWPKVQTDAYVQLVATLCAQYNIPVGHVRAHFEWAPTRKVDPAGPSPWASGTNMWNMDAFRASVTLAGAPAPQPPQPPTGENKMSVNTWWANPPVRVAENLLINSGQTLGINLRDTPVGVTVAITVSPQQEGYLTVWSGETDRPEVSNLTYTTSNITGQVDTLVADNGFFSIYAHGKCRVWIDLIATHS